MWNEIKTASREEDSSNLRSLCREEDQQGSSLESPVQETKSVCQYEYHHSAVNKNELRVSDLEKKN